MSLAGILPISVYIERTLQDETIDTVYNDKAQFLADTCWYISQFLSSIYCCIWAVSFSDSYDIGCMINLLFAYLRLLVGMTSVPNFGA